MNKEQLMNKVSKLLALAGNNPSQEEANSAYLKAQKLISEYNLNMDEFNAEKEEIVMILATHPNNNGYRTHLASVIAPNFRCKAIMHGPIVGFIGYKMDAEVCVQVFNHAYATSRRGGQKREREMRKNGYSAHGVFNSYVRGFIEGIKEVLDEQCRALMIVVPDEVSEEFQKRAGGMYKGGMRQSSFYGDDYEAGKQAGRDHMRSRQIEGR